MGELKTNYGILTNDGVRVLRNYLEDPNKQYVIKGYAYSNIEIPDDDGSGNDLLLPTINQPVWGDTSNGVFHSIDEGDAIFQIKVWTDDSIEFRCTIPREDFNNNYIQNKITESGLAYFQLYSFYIYLEDLYNSETKILYVGRTLNPITFDGSSQVTLKAVILYENLGASSVIKELEQTIPSEWTAISYDLRNPVNLYVNNKSVGTHTVVTYENNDYSILNGNDTSYSGRFMTRPFKTLKAAFDEVPNGGVGNIHIFDSGVDYETISIINVDNKRINLKKYPIQDDLPITIKTSSIPSYINCDASSLKLSGNFNFINTAGHNNPFIKMNGYSIFDFGNPSDIKILSEATSGVFIDCLDILNLRNYNISMKESGSVFDIYSSKMVVNDDGDLLLGNKQLKLGQETGLMIKTDNTSDRELLISSNVRNVSLSLTRNLTINGDANTIITSNGADRTLTLNQSLILAGTNGKTLTLNGDLTIDSSNRFVGDITGNAATVTNGVYTNDSRLSNSRKCNNTFDNAATSRTNLGLGNHVTHDYGTGPNTVCQGNDSRLLTTVEQTISGTKVFSGTHGTSPALSISGAGTRMFFYPRKAAFRAGGVPGPQWNDENIGSYSTAMGGNTIASGAYSTAMGVDTTASGNYSTALGGSSIASASYSTAMGKNTTASGYASTAMGRSSKAMGDYSTAMGMNTIASGIGSTAIGNNSKAVGTYSFAINLSSATGPDVPANTFQISGATTIGGNVAWTSPSDIRLKTDIKQIYNPLQKVLNLSGVCYSYKDRPEKSNLGFIAQEVQKVCPELVEYDELNDIYSIKESSFTAVIVEAIKEQNNLINNLKERIKILEEKGE